MIWVIVIEFFLASGLMTMRSDQGYFTITACKDEIETLARAMIHVDVRWRIACEASALEREI